MSKLVLYLKNKYHLSMKRSTDRELVGDVYQESFGPVQILDQNFLNMAELKDYITKMVR